MLNAESEKVVQDSLFFLEHFFKVFYTEMDIEYLTLFGFFGNLGELNINHLIRLFHITAVSSKVLLKECFGKKTFQVNGFP